MEAYNPNTVSSVVFNISLYTEMDLEWSLLYDDYKDQLVDQATLMLTLSGRVKETQQILATQFSFRLRTPDLIIKVSQTAHQNNNSDSNIISELTFSLSYSQLGRLWSGRRWQ